MTLLSGDKGEGYNRPDYNRKQYTTEFIVRTLNTELYRSPHTRLGLKMADQTELFMEFNSGQFTY